MKCRFCQTELTHTFVDLGHQPLSNAYIEKDKNQNMEPFYPLHTYVCSNCHLVQLDEFESPEQIFSDYAYFSSYSDSWLKHCEQYAKQMIEHFGFDSSKQVIEIASNDGYLLQYFKQAGIPVLGVEPAANVANVALEKGIPTEIAFLTREFAQSFVQSNNKADLLIGNNVLAHVPNINDFVAGLKTLLAPNGVLTMEFPHLLNLMQKNQFDTIYHEHFSYLSCLTVQQIFKHHGLCLFDVDEIPTHGGSLRIFAKHQECEQYPVEQCVANLIEREKEAGLASIDSYLSFSEVTKQVKRDLLSFLIQAYNQGKTVVGYGAPAKGNTLLNYCGIRTDLLEYTVDRSIHKQNRLLPGTHIPVFAPEKIKETKPDYVLILPWNIKDEVMEQMSFIKDWGGQFIVPIPTTEVLS